MARAGSCQIAMAVFMRRKAEPGIEGLGAWVRVQDDFLVPLAAGHKLADDRRAQPASLMGRVDGHVGDVGAVKPVSQRPPGTGQGTVGIGEAREHAVAEHGGERVRWLVAERGDPVQPGQFFPVDGAGVLGPGVTGRTSVFIAHLLPPVVLLDAAHAVLIPAAPSGRR